MIRKLIFTLLFLVLIATIGLFFVAGKIADQQMNVLLQHEFEPVSAATKELHQSLLIADWHADNLLWDRNPLTRIEHGHIDIPRLIEGNISIQVFDAVIKTPKGINYEKNTDETDNITLLAIANRWPVKTWTSQFERALHQSNKLHQAAEQSNGQLKIIKNGVELRAFLDDRKINKAQVGGLLAIEGLHALEGEIGNLKKLYEAGYRIMGLTHFFDNEVGGSSAGVIQGGLTGFGKEVIRQMNELSIVIDLAHASPALIDDVLVHTTKPIVVTHTGVQGTFQSPRNLSDDQLRRIAQNGGVVGIGFWQEAVGSTDIKAIARAIRHVITVVGIDHVCLGSDWDGATTILFGANNIDQITQTLIEEGFTPEEIRKVMGENQINFLLSQL